MSVADFSTAPATVHGPSKGGNWASYSAEGIGNGLLKTTDVLITLKMALLGEHKAHACVMAFHEKAGGSQGNSGFIVSSWFFYADKVLLPPSSRCRHASIRTLEERIVSLGACWAFSSQPVLLSVWRPVVSHQWNVAQAINAVTGTRLWAFCLLSSWNDFDSVLLFCFYAAAATVTGLLLCNGWYTSPLTHR